MKKYLACYENEWPANIAELTAVKNKPFVGYLKGKEWKFTVIPRPMWYTSTDGTVVPPYQTNAFGVNIVSNTYEEGKGVITFDGPVTSIGDYAFYRRTSLTSITIPNSVTSIGYSAFSGCSKLTSVTIPNSVTSIGSSAFQYCSKLTSVTIPNSVTSIGYDAFWYCSALTSITIPNSVTSIGKEPFNYCESLASIVVEEGNTMYDSRENCNAIIETASNTLIQGCKNSIIPNSVTNIGNYAFIYCLGLTSITIPNSVTSIGSSAFATCRSLTSIAIPNSVTSIGSHAFYYCTGLTSIIFGNSVTSIGDMVFYNCSALTSITCEATTPPALGANNTRSNVTAVYVPAESVDAYKTAANWSEYADKIQPIQ